MERAFGERPVKAILGPDLACIFESEEQVRNMKPDQGKLAIEDATSKKPILKRQKVTVEPVKVYEAEDVKRIRNTRGTQN